MIYYFVYLSDLQNQYLIKSFVNLINIEQNERRLTTTEEDKLLVPPVFKSNTQVVSNRFNLPKCYELAIPRYCQLFLSSNSYVFIQIPFLPNSNNFNLFFDQVNSNSLIVSSKYFGEKIQADHLRRLR